jgi:hypothetical protein
MELDTHFSFSTESLLHRLRAKSFMQLCSHWCDEYLTVRPNFRLQRSVRKLRGLQLVEDGTETVEMSFGAEIALGKDIGDKVVVVVPRM